MTHSTKEISKDDGLNQATIETNEDNESNHNSTEHAHSPVLTLDYWFSSKFNFIRATGMYLQ